MRFVVDEMPYWSDDCPFHYDGGCTLQHGDTCHYLNPWYKDLAERGECPCLVTFKEVQDEQRAETQSP